MSPGDSSGSAGPLLIVLSGPSGVGKDAVLSRMKARARPFHFTVTATTRTRRAGEVDGVDYHFVTRRRFQSMIDRGELLEWAEVHGQLYGVPREQVVKALREGRDVIVKPDIQGAATIKRLAPDAVLIFLAPPSAEELARRLTQRMTESPDTLALRLRAAEKEMAAATDFDHVVVNHGGRLDEAIRRIEEIVDGERTRLPLRSITL